MQELRLTPDLLHRARLRRPGPARPRPTGSSSSSPPRSGNFWTLQHAQLYSEPERLAKAGYLTEERERGGRRRKLYAITDKGREALDEWRSEPTDAILELRAPALLKLFFGADPASWRRSRSSPTGASWPSTSGSATRCPTTSQRARGWRSTPASRPSASRSSGGRRLRSPPMATAAEPRPAELPLPGGREGARVKLHPLLTGETSGPQRLVPARGGPHGLASRVRLRDQEGGLDQGAGAGLPRGAPRRRADPDRHRLPSVGRRQADGEPRAALAIHLQGHPDEAGAGGRRRSCARAASIRLRSRSW